MGLIDYHRFAGIKSKRNIAKHTIQLEIIVIINIVISIP